MLSFHVNSHLEKELVLTRDYFLRSKSMNKMGLYNSLYRVVTSPIIVAIIIFPCF